MGGDATGEGGRGREGGPRDGGTCISCAPACHGIRLKLCKLRPHKREEHFDRWSSISPALHLLHCITKPDWCIDVLEAAIIQDQLREIRRQRNRRAKATIPEHRSTGNGQCLGCRACSFPSTSKRSSHFEAKVPMSRTGCTCCSLSRVSSARKELTYLPGYRLLHD